MDECLVSPSDLSACLNAFLQTKVTLCLLRSCLRCPVIQPGQLRGGRQLDSGICKHIGDGKFLSISRGRLPVCHTLCFPSRRTRILQSASIQRGSLKNGSPKCWRLLRDLVLFPESISPYTLPYPTEPAISRQACEVRTNPFGPLCSLHRQYRKPPAET